MPVFLSLFVARKFNLTNAAIMVRVRNISFMDRPKLVSVEF